MKKENEPIYPHLEHTHSGEVLEYSKGLTKREYFAGLAMQGLMVQAIPGSHNINDKDNNLYRAKFAVDMADELLKQLGE
jgi:hypothetical protein